MNNRVATAANEIELKTGRETVVHTCSGKKGILGAILLAGIVMLFAAQADAAKMYKWVDKNGVVHYSDRMPPETSTQAHEELDESGITRREVERAKTEEEIETEQEEKKAEQQQRRANAEKQARQRMRDQILLQTFTTERDLLITRNDRVNAVDSIIDLTTSNNKHLAKQIKDTNRKITKFKNSGRGVPENLAKQLESLNAQFQKNREFIEHKEKERKELSASFDADLQRFRELKGIVPKPEENPGQHAGTEAGPDATAPSPLKKATGGAHEELDGSGIVQHEVESAKSAEGLMTEETKKTAEEQKQHSEAEKQARQRMHDQMLLQTFTTERDLLITRDDRVNAVNSTINLSTSNNKHLAEQIKETNQKITKFKNSGREVPDKLVKQLESLSGQFEKNREFIERKKKELKDLNDSFDADLQRFRELKGIVPKGDEEPKQHARTEDAPEATAPPPKEATENQPEG